MKINLINIGCKVNFAETSRLKDIFSKRGYEIVDSETEADYVLINSCTVTNRADSDCRKIIRKARRNAPNAFIGVFGCYAQTSYAELAEMDEVDAIFGMKEKFKIPDIIDSISSGSVTKTYVSDLEDLHFDAAVSYDNESRARAFLKIQDGCEYRCTYCAIPGARGGNRGIEFDDLPNQFQIIRDGDYLEAVISGINIGEYKSSDGKRFTDVVKYIADNEIGFRVRISSIEPNLVKDEIIDSVVNSPNFCNHFHIPLQSGSPDILKLMKRRYNVDRFKEVINKIKAKDSNCCIGVDVIVGFPGETDEKFDETYKLIDSLPIDYLHVFTYSERKNTPAAEFNGIVPNGIRKARTLSLRDLSEKKIEAFYKSQIGRVLNFLPETFNEKRKIAIGHTENYVHVFVDTEVQLENKLYKVELLSYENGKVKAKIV